MPELRIVADFDGLITQALVSCAKQLTIYGDLVRAEAIVETRSLRFPFVLGLAEQLQGRDLEIVEEASYDVGDRFFKARGIDVLVDAGTAGSIGIELKAGAGPTGLYQCAWDAVKMATWLHGSDVREACLVAAAPASVWAQTRKNAGIEFFDEGEHDTRELGSASRYGKYFDGWFGANGQGPVNVPDAFSTSTLSVQSVELKHASGGPRVWEIRASAIRVRASSMAVSWRDESVR